MVRQAGFEPAAFGSGDLCTTHLSYFAFLLRVRRIGNCTEHNRSCAKANFRPKVGECSCLLVVVIDDVVVYEEINAQLAETAKHVP
jgi:hypothetical protein